MLSNGALARVVAAVGPAVLALGTATGVQGQYETVPRPGAYALEGVTLVEADGERMDGVTIVVRGALIEAIGRNVTVPADAEVLEGEDLMVYPGLVDAVGKADHEFPEPEIDRSEIEIWNAPRVLQGFMPARRLASFLQADGDDAGPQRREGIVAAAVHPADAMMPGRGALVLYRLDADAPSDLVIDPELGPVFAFRGGRGVYPGTLFGVTAFMRQALEDAAHRATVHAAYEEDPRRLTMPPHDPDYAVLQSVLEGDLPVFFAADEAADILRALGLADEYGFRPIIVGGGEAWKVADELRRRNVPVLVSTDFGEPRRWDPDAEAGEPLDAAAEREKRSFEDRWSNPGRLADAGVTFALTSGGTGKILEGARRAVSNGLDPAAALRALTRSPAELLGTPELARVEEGLPATFLVTDGPLFEEESRVVYTLVEGRVEEAGEQRAAGSAEDAADFSGEWDVSIQAGNDRIAATLTIVQDGATFTGEMSMQGQRLEVRDGVINGNDVSMVAIMSQGGDVLEVEMRGTVEGDEANGDADAGPLGTARWTATRTGPGGVK